MHPYAHLPDQNFWKRFVSDTSWRDLQIAHPPKFKLSSTTKISTAGSCFAQHISRYLMKTGRCNHVVETPHPLVVEFGGEVDSYKTFSARYGNVYTSRQCLEMFQQALGLRPMVNDYLQNQGRVCDLLRPNAIPSGFASLQEALADRHYHLAFVKKLAETADVFVFTLGLTESWYNVRDGHTYPACPGTVRGEFDTQLHRFQNLSYGEVLEDLESLITMLRAHNPNLRLVLTVAPVPLVATHEAKSVLLASSYSKSVLRAVCGELDARHAHLQYFSSYEIVSHTASFGQYLASDLREVTERGVSHVMSSFFATYFDNPSPELTAPARAVEAMAPSAPVAVASAGAECEEMYNDFMRKN
jgi:hypothetical protein